MKIQEIKEFDCKDYNICELLDYNKEWLDVIVENRIYGACHISDIDIIYDRMADNKGDVLGKELANYLKDKKNCDEVIEKIKFKNETKDQYCFKTSKALQLLINRKLIIDKRNRRGYWNNGKNEIYPVRFNEVTNLIAKITGKDYDTVAQRVYDTEIGKAINLNREDILYEQVTDNVLSVVKELGKKNPEILNICTPERITSEYLKNKRKRLKNSSRHCHLPEII